MKTAWIVLLISALTDFIITAGGMVTSALVTMSTPDWPPSYVFLMAFTMGLVAAARTVQQTLKTTPETVAALKGDVSVVTTSTVAKTP